MSSDKRPNDNPLLPTKEEVHTFNPHHGNRFGYNRMLLADENIERELELMREARGAGLMSAIEMRLFDLIDAIRWVEERRPQ